MTLPTALAPAADELADQVLKAPGSGGRPFIVSGQPGAGKTELLGLTSARLSDAGLKPICLSPSVGDIDAPAAALLGAASGFASVGAATPEQLLGWRETRPFDAHLDDLRTWT